MFYCLLYLLVYFVSFGVFCFFKRLLYLLVSLARYSLTDEMKSEIVHIHNSLRRNFAQGSEEVFVANMNKLVSLFIQQ